MLCSWPRRWLSSCVLAALALPWANAIELDTTSADSIASAAKTIAHDMMTYYTGNNTGDNPGNLPDPYFWWEAGAMFGKLVEYWYYTGDESYIDETIQAITWQAGTTGTFMPENQTRTEGNDDQVFWAYTALAAAELGFPAPPDDYPSWAAMAQAVFNTQAARWDTSTCGGGLRWQIFTWNSGYTYKNTPSNGGLFMLAARLARYTGNQTYVEWAEKTWDWWTASVLFDTSDFSIYDGTDDRANCTDADHTQWSYNYGFFIGGLAYLYNHTSDSKWLTPLEGILKHTLGEFFPQNMGPDIAVEVACEPFGTCQTDGFCFKGFLLRWMTEAIQLVPSLYDQVWPFLEASGKGAAGQCVGQSGTTCGMRWNSTTWDGLAGVGEQMSSLSAVQNLMINVKSLTPPLTESTGGTSKSDGSAGTEAGSSTSSSNPGDNIATRVITTADRAGAGILTALCIVVTLVGAYWMVTGG